MELSDGSRAVVDPEVRAYVSSLVTALGGSGADEDGRYVLGDDALACLRDLKRWLKLYDEKANRLDVARCLAESNLVNGDLLQILAAWPEHATDDKIKSRIALACLELLVPLTWPLDTTREMTVNHHRHTPYLQLAQVGYKRSIINFDGARILHTAVRVALPSMAVSISERKTRDEGMIKLVLYFIRNIAMIAPPPNVEYDGDEAEISRSATIDAFDYQDIFHLLLALSSAMGEDFNTQDVVVMEILFHLIKGVNIEKLFMDEAQLDNHKVDELVSLRSQEAGMLRGYARIAPSRHNRFGTMIWVKRDDEKMSTVSGQSALLDNSRTLAKMDKSKKYKPPRRAPKTETGPMEFDTPVPLNTRVNKNLRKFVEDFLDSGFNPLFQNIRKAIDREAERVLDYHPQQFFFLVSWFLEAERTRRKSKKAKKSKKEAATQDADSFGLVASVLNQEMFITLNRAMEKTYEEKSWQGLKAAMKCFTQILLTVQEMTESELEDDQDIAENILNRIFYEETTHDRVANIVRYFKDQGFGYLDACTELSHVYLRILENYSKQNADLQVRSRRRVRRKKKVAITQDQDDEGETANIDDSGDDEAEVRRTSSERKFDFKRFASRFLSQGCIDTFVTFCGFFNDLKADQLKRAHRFFYRVAFKMEMSVMLFRVDIIALFHKMIKGPEGLDSAATMFKEWDELVKQLLKRCTRKIEERPELLIELLFSKTNSTAHYLEYGYEKQTVAAKPRAAAEMEVKSDFEWEQQIGVVVSSLLDRNEGHHLQWVKTQLSTAETERRSWEGANKVIPSVDEDPFAENLGIQSTDNAEAPKAPSIMVKPDTDACRLALFKNGYLRLLLNLVGFQRLSEEDDPSTSWIIPSSLSADQLTQYLSLIKAAEFSPPVFDDGKEAADFIRRKSAGSSYKRREAFDDESDGGIDDDEEEFLFPAGGPTAMKKSDALAVLKKIRRRRQREGSEDDEDTGLTDEQLRERQNARDEREREKQRKIKSALYVHDSDDESDEERDRAFFDREEKLRNRQKVTVMKELLGAGKPRMQGNENVMPGAKVKPGKRSALVLEDSDEEMDNGIPGTRRPSGSETTPAEETDTPLSSPHIRSPRGKRARLVSDDGDEHMGSPDALETIAKDVSMGSTTELNQDDDEDDDVPVSRPVRRRAVGGFIDDSSDDE